MKKIRIAIILTALCVFAPAEQKEDLSGAAHKALAKVSGQLRIQGLDRPVNVLRDDANNHNLLQQGRPFIMRLHQSSVNS